MDSRIRGIQIYDIRSTGDNIRSMGDSGDLRDDANQSPHQSVLWRPRLVSSRRSSVSEKERGRKRRRKSQSQNLIPRDIARMQDHHNTARSRKKKMEYALTGVNGSENDVEVWFSTRASKF